MYIPKTNLTTDKSEIVAFMKQFSFATIVTAKDSLPIATHLPFLVTTKDNNIVLTSHFAKANEHWQDIENNKVLVIFSEPHAYVSTKNYDKELNVPTWNYISIHAYGQGKLITETENTFEVLEATIDNYEAEYRQHWDNFPKEYKLKMSKGIVAFEILVTELQAKKKLSQNRTDTEQKKIIETLSNSKDSNETIIAEYMKENLTKKKKKKQPLTAVCKMAGLVLNSTFGFQKKFSSKLKASTSKSATSPSCETFVKIIRTKNLLIKNKSLLLSN